MRYENLVRDAVNRCFLGSCEDIAAIPDEVVHCVVTSPPYFGLRDYGTGKWEGGDAACDHKRPKGVLAASTTNSVSPNANHALMPWPKGVCGRCGATKADAQIGVEETIDAYIARMVGVFRGIRRVLRDDGVVWLNMGDSWTSQGGPQVVQTRNSGRSGGSDSQNGGAARQPVDGLKSKDLMMVPARLAIALCDNGWVLRDEIVWAKPNPMPESITDRTTRCHEMIYLLAKSNESRFWTHRDGMTGLRSKPDPDYRWQDIANGNEEVEYEPADWKAEQFYDRRSGKLERRWRRVNLWTGHDYFYDHFAIREPLTSGPSDLRKMMRGEERLGGRTLGNEDPLYKANESSNIGKKRGVGGGFGEMRKQDQMGARFEGFNDRWRESVGRVDPMIGQPTLMDVPDAEPAPPWNKPGKGSREAVTRDAAHEGLDPGKGARFAAAYERGVTPENCDRRRREDYAVIGRNKRSVWEIATAPFKDAHFATFPSELPSLCIRAGSSEFGCCADCGAPRSRVSRVFYENPGNRATNGPRSTENREITAGFEERLERREESVGSVPTCRCEAATVPCLVLDPFMGSGTVAEVAEGLGRRWAGFELNPAYHDLIRARTRQQGLFTSTEPLADSETAR